jgi:GntR family transcriptional regulator/MocR family aminotransferase
MQDAIIYIDPDKPVSLQNQIRQKLVDGIINGVFPPGMKLPSSRKLSGQLEVARNTVVAAYQLLIADGYLISRQRSGVFVNEKILESRVAASGRRHTAHEDRAALWMRGNESARRGLSDVQDLPNWSLYPYPFIDGQFDASLFPLTEWREANRLSMSVADVREWSAGSGDADDPMLLEEIRTKILTRRGIQAETDQILVTTGTQNSLYLISRLLTETQITVAMEEPGNSSVRELFRQSGSSVRPQSVDESGLVVDASLSATDVVYVTPSHQIPTAVAMSLQRRQALMSAAHDGDLTIIEDDYECETSYMDHPLPALRSMDSDGRVIYVASFSNVLGPGIRLGFIVADARFIRRARHLRSKILEHPPYNNQRTAAYFLSLGHYDALMLRLGRVLRERRMRLRSALTNVRGIPLEISPEVGGTTYWVRAPSDFDVGNLVLEAEREGLLIEPVSHYYAIQENAENCFRMGVTSLSVDKIRPGVERLMELVRKLVRGQVEHLSTSSGKWLTGDELVKTMAGATLLDREVYGWPCTIVYHPDGTMSGRRGFANEDIDAGRWRVEGDRFYRKWNRWVFGEEKGYFIVIDGDKIKFFNEEQQIVDSLLLRLADKSPEPESRNLDP